MEIEEEPQKLIQPEDQQPYSLENMPITISADNYTVSLPDSILQISEEGFTILQAKPEDQWISIFTSFENTTSIGVSNNSLLIFIGDTEDEQEQQMPQILKIISSDKPCNISLIGHCFTVCIDFTKEGKNVLKEVNDILTNYMGDADERRSKFDQDEDFQEMISANDIDENGNIIKSFENRQQSEEDESSQEQEIKIQKEKHQL